MGMLFVEGVAGDCELKPKTSDKSRERWAYDCPDGELMSEHTAISIASKELAEKFKHALDGAKVLNKGLRC